MGLPLRQAGMTEGWITRGLAAPPTIISFGAFDFANRSGFETSDFDPTDVTLVALVREPAGLAVLTVGLLGLVAQRRGKRFTALSRLGVLLWSLG
jgi:hypothetical protein